MSPPDPLATYAARLADRQAAADRVRLSLDRLGQFRVLVVAGGLLAGLVGGVSGLFPVGWAAVALVPLFGLFLAGKVLDSRRATLLRAAGFYRLGLDRLAGKWVGRGPAGDRFTDPAHLYAVDLDLFGRGSLFERISTARTADGEAVLAGWLLAPADAGEVRSRQEAVQDLRGRLDLREHLAVVAAGRPADLAPLAAWGREPLQPVPAWRRWAVELLGWYNLLAVGGWLLAGTSGLPVLVGLAASVFVVWPLVGWARAVCRPADAVAHDLSRLEALLARLDAEPFAAPRLAALQGAFAGDRPSARVRALRGLADWYAARRNALFLPIAVLLLWDVRMAVRFDAWRRRHGPAVGRWLAAVAELEALGSLAGYSFENPADPFPDLLPHHPSGPVFDAAGLGHPLLPADRCVRNDVALGADRVLVVSGSNMSGKSTLLRAVGANAVLALAGGPVRADRLALAPVRVGATVRVLDSLHDNRSRFFAEVTRVRAVLEAARAGVEGGPVLFLFDELFAGTNSADRVAGAAGVLRELVGRGAVGLVTTHDLALTAVAGDLAGARNVHFADQVVGGRMGFDYRMRPGVVPHGNGLALMRAVGLDV